MKVEYRKKLQFLCDVCNRCMDEFDCLDENYDFWANDDPTLQGYGFKFFGKEDKFMPIIDISYSVLPEPHIAILVENRNGNDVINGNNIAVYMLNVEYKEKMSEKEIKEIDERYRKMVKHSIEKWAIYNKENQLGYVEDEEERLEF